MRTIKFRGIDCEGNFVYGDLIHKRHCKETVLIQDEKGLGSDVDISTVGQFAELYDKHDDEIYEDDIIVWTIYHADFDGLGVLKKDIISKYKGVVKWHQGGFVLKDMEGDGYYSISNLSSNADFEIIGNIHDNPELLKIERRNNYAKRYK